MQVDPQSAYANYDARLRADVDPTYRAEAKRFLRFSQGDFSRDTLLGFLQALAKDEYAPGTIVKKILPIVRRLYKVNGIDWPLLPGEAPKLREADIYSPALHPDVVAKLIRTAKTTAVTPAERALLALSTTYGVRRVEMAGINQHQIDLASRTLMIHTAKGGRDRWHLIPEEIVSCLDIPWVAKSPALVTKAYLAIEAAAGVARMYEVGWHAIRRILVRLLVQAEVPGLMLDNFMRWKRGGSDMKRLYFDSTVVSESGEHVEMGQPDREVDLAIFKIHPFLKLWRS